MLRQMHAASEFPFDFVRPSSTPPDPSFVQRSKVAVIVSDESLTVLGCKGENQGVGQAESAKFLRRVGIFPMNSKKACKTM